MEVLLLLQTISHMLIAGAAIAIAVKLRLNPLFQFIDRPQRIACPLGCSTDSHRKITPLHQSAAVLQFHRQASGLA